MRIARITILRVFSVDRPCRSCATERFDGYDKFHASRTVILNSTPQLLARDLCAAEVGRSSLHCRTKRWSFGWLQVQARLLGLPLNIVPADQELSQLAGELKAMKKMSLADCFAAALDLVKRRLKSVEATQYRLSHEPTSLTASSAGNPGQLSRAETSNCIAVPHCRRGSDSVSLWKNLSRECARRSRAICCRRADSRRRT
jgi:hypothetical protein